MKKIFIVFSLVLIPNLAAASTVDIMTGASVVGGIVSGAVITKTSVDNSKKTTDAMVRNLDAQTENIKKGSGFQVIKQADGTAKVYQNGIEITTTANPNSPEYKMGLKMAESMSNYFERKDAKAKIKEVKALAKIEKDTKTLEIIKKYKKAGPVITLKKIEESKK